MKRIVEEYDPQVQRILEMLPGMSAWLIILFPLWGAFFIPRIVAYFTIAFLVFWFYRSFQAAFLGIRGYSRIRQSEKTNWHQRYKKDKDKNSLEWEEIKHLIIIPNYNESVEKLSSKLVAFREKVVDKAVAGFKGDVPEDVILNLFNSLEGIRYHCPPEVLCPKSGAAVERERYSVPDMTAGTISASMEALGVDIAHVEGVNAGFTVEVFDVNPFPSSHGASLQPMSARIAKRLEQVYDI